MRRKVDARQRRREKVAANVRALRARRALEAAAAVSKPTAGALGDDPVANFLHRAVAWATAERTPLAGSLAAMAGDLIEKYEPESEDYTQIEAARRAMFGAHYDPGPAVGADSLQRQIATANLTLAAETLASGRAGPPDVRAGIRACAQLIRRRTKPSSNALALAFASVNANAGPPPKADQQCDCSWFGWYNGGPFVHDKTITPHLYGEHPGFVEWDADEPAVDDVDDPETDRRADY